MGVPTGCTSKDDFELLQQEAKGVYEFALKRNKADLCRAMPRAYPVTFKLPEAIDSIDLIKVLNPRYDSEAQKAAKHTRQYLSSSRTPANEPKTSS